MALKRIFLPLLFFVLLHKYVEAGTFSVDYTNHVFLKDGKPFQYISGSCHYFRIHPDYWNDRLQRVRAAGLNVISTYVPWNYHEPMEGKFDFSGPRNFTNYLTLAQQNGLNVLLRASPFIDAEWEFGGLPYWLLKNREISLRVNNPNYTAAITNYYNVLLPLVKPFLYKNGGPVLMIQIENEYGIAGCDRNYTAFIRDLIWSILGNDTVLYTTNPSSETSVSCGHVPNTLTTVDFPTSDHNTIDQHFQLQDKYSNGAPHVVSEFYNSWGVVWDSKKANADKEHRKSILSTFVDNVEYMHNQCNASINMYMIHGGTTFEFYNGAGNGDASPYITKYWVNSPIDENGDITDMYLEIRSFIQNLTNWENPPLAVPSNNPVVAYGNITVNRVGTNLISTLTQIQEPCTNSQDPLSFEEIDHPFGYVLYTTTLTTSGTNFAVSYIKDYGYVFVNNVYQGMLSRDKNISALKLTIAAKQGDILRVLVENSGRDEHWGGGYPVENVKGVRDNVTLDGTLLQNWFQCGINLTKGSIDSLSTNFLEEHPKSQPQKASTSQPGVFIGQFTIDNIQDTYFDSTGWGKGQLFINGYNLGRYWPKAGPQMTLYVPKPVLQQKNTVLLIELNGAQQNYANFINHSIFT